MPVAAPPRTTPRAAPNGVRDHRPPTPKLRAVDGEVITIDHGRVGLLLVIDGEVACALTPRQAASLVHLLADGIARRTR